MAVVAVDPMTTTWVGLFSMMVRLSVVVEKGLVPPPTPPLVRSAPQVGKPPNTFRTVPAPPMANLDKVLEPLA